MIELKNKKYSKCFFISGDLYIIPAKILDYNIRLSESWDDSIISIHYKVELNNGWRLRDEWCSEVVLFSTEEEAKIAVEEIKSKFGHFTFPYQEYKKYNLKE